MLKWRESFIQIIFLFTKQANVIVWMSCMVTRLQDFLLAFPVTADNLYIHTRVAVSTWEYVIGLVPAHLNKKLIEF